MFLVVIGLALLITGAVLIDLAKDRRVWKCKGTVEGNPTVPANANSECRRVRGSAYWKFVGSGTALVVPGFFAAIIGLALCGYDSRD